MRRLLVLVPVVVGCEVPQPAGPWEGGGFAGVPEVDEGMLAYSVSVDIDTRGLYVPDDRPWAVAGMGGLTCQLDMSFGSTGTDVNVDAAQEGVVDGRDRGATSTVLVQSPSGWQTVAFPSGEFGDRWTIDGGVSSALVGGGHVDLAWADGACSLTWRGDADARVELPEAYCADGGAMAVTDDDAVWVGADETIAYVTVEGYREIPVGGRDLALDRSTGTLIAASHGSSAVAAVLADGSIAWRADMDGSIAGFDAASGRAIVALAAPNGADTELLVLDAPSGDELSRQVARGVRPGAVQASGTHVGVVSDRRFDFFRFE